RRDGLDAAGGHADGPQGRSGDGGRRAVRGGQDRLRADLLGSGFGPRPTWAARSDRAARRWRGCGPQVRGPSLALERTDPEGEGAVIHGPSDRAHAMGEFRYRIRGVLIGLAAGDRNGGPIRMALRLAESLSDRQRFDPDDVLARYLAWWRDGAFDSGRTAATVLSLIEGGMEPAEAVKRVHDQSGGMTAGCNPAHRCAPLAMAMFVPDDELAGCALREARLTHQHPLAGDFAA